MNFGHLRTFVAIVDAGGVHRAAARLNLSQPAVSRQIRALESDLGVPLFDRIGRRVQLTSEGEDLLRRTRRLLAEAESLSERAGALKTGETGILRVGATPQVIESTLSGFLNRFREIYPGVEVQLVEEGGTRLPGLLERGHILLALMAVDDERFDYRLVYPVHGLAVVGKTHKLARRRTLDIAELADEPLVLLRGGFASRDWFEAACSLAHFRPRVLLETAAPHTAIALAASGYGIALVPSTVQMPRGRVHAVALVQRGAALGRWMRIAWDPQRSLAPYAKRFVEELVPYCRRSYPGRELMRSFPRLLRPKELTG
jgi:LysR family transcriptional regulator, cyn operon transcriptional activator